MNCRTWAIENLVRLAACCTLLMGLNGPLSVVAQDDRGNLTEAVQRMASSVVRIELIGGAEDLGGTQTSVSGVVVDEAGHVLSAGVYFQDRPAGMIARDAAGATVPIRLLAFDRARHLALLKLEGAPDVRWAVPKFAPDAKLQVGQSVAALGRGLSEEGIQLTRGRVSALHRIWGRAVQTDAGVSPANYGGPLIDLQGRVLGILVPLSPKSEDWNAGREWYDSGVGFAARIDRTLEALDRLRGGEDLEPGVLGIQPTGGDLVGKPLTVAYCPGQSPAGRAGIRPGDVLATVDRKPVRRLDEWRHALGPLYSGDEIRLTVLRDGQELEFKTSLAAKLPPYQPTAVGVTARASSEAVEKSSLEIVQLADWIDAQPPLQQGDRWLTFNGQSIESRAQLRLAIASAAPDQPSNAEVIRNNQELSVQILVQARQARLSTSDTVGRSEGPERLALLRDLKVAGSTNRAELILPTQPGASIPLLVWFRDPDKNLTDAEKQEWRRFAEALGCGVLFPEPGDVGQWSRRDSEFVQSAIPRLDQQQSIDFQRITVGGTGAGGAIASRLAMREPQRFQGLILDGAQVPFDLKLIEARPQTPLMVMLTQVPPDFDPEIWESVRIPFWKSAQRGPQRWLDWACWVDRL